MRDAEIAAWGGPVGVVLDTWLLDAAETCLCVSAVAGRGGTADPALRRLRTSNPTRPV